jgi:SAM-dependent methyltransferase
MIMRNAPLVSTDDIQNAHHDLMQLRSAYEAIEQVNYGANLLGSYLDRFQLRLADQLAVVRHLLGGGDCPKSVLSVGGWPAAIAAVVRADGHDATLLDHPSLLAPDIASFCAQRNIATIELDLGSDPTMLNQIEDRFDVIECCQCLEHWSFNPIPIVERFVQLLKPDGYLYITVPNAISLFRRVSHLLGRTPYPSMADFQRQCDASQCADVSPHWREYTFADLQQLIHHAGGKVASAWYQFHPTTPSQHRRLPYHVLMRLCPPLSEGLGLVARRD